MRRVPLVLAIPAVAGVLAACDDAPADVAASGPLVVRDAWVRSADSGDTGGAYLTLASADTMTLTIVGLSTPVSDAADVHETMQMQGMVHMMARPDLVIPRDSTVTMAPGGLHIMLARLNRALRVGDTVPLALTLADGRSIPVALPVRAP